MAFVKTGRGLKVLDVIDFICNNLERMHSPKISKLLICHEKMNAYCFNAATEALAILGEAQRISTLTSSILASLSALLVRGIAMLS